MTTKTKNQLIPAILEPPRIIWIMGLAGTGKRTFSKALIKKLPCFVRLDKEVLQNALCGEDRSSPDYNKYYKGQSYDALWALAIDNAKDGKSVLIHSTNTGFYKGDYKELIQRKLQGLNVLLKVIYCIAPETEIRKRLTDRGFERDYSKLINDDAWRHFRDKELQFTPPPIYHLKIDTSLNENDNVNKAKGYILNSTSSITFGE